MDWTESMEQSFEYYEVDPNTWKDKKLLDTVKSCTISRDYEADTLGSASIDLYETLGECYVRVYLVATQNKNTYRYSLGVFLLQTPSSSFDGKIRTVSVDAYTPLLELKENPVPLGYSLLKGDNIMTEAYQLVRDNCRAPVVSTSSDKTLSANFVSETSDTWLSYIKDLVSQAKYELYLDDEGKILFNPVQKVDQMQPVWTFNDDNSSILYPELSLDHDLYGIPNKVEVVCTTTTGTLYSEVINDDPASPTSTVNRGRTIIHRDTSPSLSGNPTQEQLDEYAESLLESLSSVEYTVSYSHGYCPVRIGDCVRLNYSRAGLNDIKAKVITQSIKCQSGCSVSEKATFTKKLWK